jgi:hypothetical protein
LTMDREVRKIKQNLQQKMADLVYCGTSTVLLTLKNLTR